MGKHLFLRQIRQRSRPFFKRTGKLQFCHPVQLEQPEIFSRPAPAPQIPAGPLENQIIRLHSPAGFSGRRMIGKGHQPAAFYRSMEQLNFGRKRRPVPGGQINQNMRIACQKIRSARKQLFHKLRIPVRPAHAVQAPKPCQNRLHVRRSEQRPVYCIAFHDGNAAARSARGHNRDSCHAEAFNIPVDRPPGYLELLRKPGSRHLLFLQQHCQNPYHSIKLHRFSPDFQISSRIPVFCLFLKYRISKQQILDQSERFPGHIMGTHENLRGSRNPKGIYFLGLRDMYRPENVEII